MNKLNLFKLFISLPIVIMTGCNNNSDVLVEQQKPTFTLSEKILANSRAPQLNGNGAGKFTDGDQNTVFLHSPEEKTTSYFTYTYGQTHYWSSLPLNSKQTNINVSACYPTIETNSPEDFQWDITGKGENADLLFSKPVCIEKGTSTPIEQTFAHALHKLRVNFKSGSQAISEKQLENLIVQCQNVRSVAHLNLLEGKATKASGKTLILESRGAVTEFIIPAQSVQGIKLSIRLDDRIQEYDLAQNITDITELESGKSFTLNITVNEKEFTISGQDISGWENQGEFNDSIII